MIRLYVIMQVQEDSEHLKGGDLREIRGYCTPNKYCVQ